MKFIQLGAFFCAKMDQITIKEKRLKETLNNSSRSRDQAE